MRILDTVLQAHADQDVTTFASCWMITTRDGAVTGFTSHDVDLLFSGIVFRSVGVSQTTNMANITMETDNIEIYGLLEGNEEDLMFDRQYDNAKIDIFDVNYKNLPSTITDTSVIWINNGIIGDIFIKKGKWVIECRDFIQILKQEIGVKTSRLCRAEFGDSDCGADLNLFSKTGSITNVSGRNIETDITGLNVNDMQLGRLDIISRNISFDILSSVRGTFVLAETPNFDLNNEAVVAFMGCDLWITTCRNRFDNLPNYQGEPGIPTGDEWAAGFYNTISV